MEFIKENRRRYYFKNPFDFDFDFNGITSSGDSISFPKSNKANSDNDRLKFKNIEDCKRWTMEYNYSYNLKNFKSMEKRYKALSDINSKTLSSESEFDKIVPFMLAPDEIEPKDIFVVESSLANNVVDRDRERFSAPTLNNLKSSIIGKSKLQGHDWSGLGEGTFYDSKIVKYTSVDDFLKTIGYVPDGDFREILEYVLDVEKSLQWLMVKYYMPIIDPGRILDIKARKPFMSIGFRSPERVDVKYPQDESQIWFREYRETKGLKSEALEGSDVFLGSQHGAGAKGFQDNSYQESLFTFTKSISDIKEIEEKYIENLNDECFAVIESKTVDSQTQTFRHLPHHVQGAKGNDSDVDIPLLKEALANLETIKDSELQKEAKEHLESHAKNLNIFKNNEETMILKSKHIGDKEITEETNIEIVKLFDDKIDELVGDAKTANDIIESVKEVFGVKADEDFDIESLKVILQKSTDYENVREDLEAEVVKMAYHSKSVEFDGIKAHKEILKEKTVEELKDMLKTYREKYAADNSNAKKLPWADVTQPKEENETKDSDFDVSNYRPNSAFSG